MNLTKLIFVTGTAGFICRKICETLFTKLAPILVDLTSKTSMTTNVVRSGSAVLIEFSREFKMLFKEKVSGEAKI